VLAALVMIPTSIIWAAAQIQAFALVLAAISPIPADTALIVAVAVVITYTWLGGLLGDVISDVVQSTIIIG
jgi:Na+/proline symporter